jgi:hypothetical protein
VAFILCCGPGMRGNLGREGGNSSLFALLSIYLKRQRIASNPAGGLIAK